MNDDTDMRDEFGARWARGDDNSDLSNHLSNHNHRYGADETEAIPHELRGVYARLLTDGAAWSATTVAAPDALIRYAQALPATEPMIRAEPTSVSAVNQQTLAVKETPTIALLPIRTPRPRSGEAPRRPRWPSALWAPVAVVLLVALVAAVFYGFAIRFRSPAINPTASKTPTVAGVHGRWVKLAGLDYTTGYQDFLYPVVAPSDPQVAYEPLVKAAQNLSGATLRRTDDGGKTWHALALPVSDVASAAIGGVAVSPLDAHTVIVSIARADLTTCPTGVYVELTSAPPQITCYVQYISRDGGASWRQLTLPTAGILVQVGQFATGLFPLMLNPFYAQGHDLYALAAGGYPPVTNDPRLLMSADGGLTWRAVDTALNVGLTGHNDLCAFAPTPTGATVFAVTTTAQQTCVSEGIFTLWRSDDAGVHWRSVTTLPTHALDGLLISERSGATPVLYADFPQVLTGGGGVDTIATAHDLNVSVDGGLTWKPLSTSDAALSGPPNAGGRFTLPVAWTDGGVIRGYAPGKIGTSTRFYAWTPATQEWQAITPTVTAAGNGVVTVSGDAITLISSNAKTIAPESQPVTYTFWRYVF